MDTTSEGPETAAFLLALRQLEDRISRIETHIGLSPVHEDHSTRPLNPSPDNSLAANENLERQIGESLFAPVGIIVLAIGVAFLLTLPFPGLPPALPSLFGYLLVGATGTLSYRWRESLPQLSHYILAGTIVMLYFTTLRLHFFSPVPAIAGKDVELFSLLLAVVVSGAVATQRRSPYLAAISITTGFLTALVGGQPLFVFTVCLVLSLAAVVLSRRYSWYSLLIYATATAYLTLLLWALNNPLMGNALTLAGPSPLSAIFILLHVFVLAGGTVLRRSEFPENGSVAAASFLNGLAGYGLYFLLALSGSATIVSVYNGAASGAFLVLSIIFWKRERSRHSTFAYSTLGYVALSVAIIAAFPRPDYFVWLACQSILVISTAIWFRSKFIVGTNFVIYLMLFIAYLLLAGTVSVISMSFGLVALLSARLLNWQKNRLELRTEMMRNAYLACAFLIFPYTLYHTVPASYVSMSWVFVAVFYFLMSVLLKNRKYRWMALLTLCLTVGYVFFVDIARLDPAFRVISFLVLGIALFGISMLYAKKRTSIPQAHQDESVSERIQEHT